MMKNTIILFVYGFGSMLGGFGFLLVLARKAPDWMRLNPHRHGVIPIICVILIFTIAWFWSLSWIGSAILAIPPQPGAAPVPVDELRARLHSLESDSTPLRVIEEDGRVVIEWKYLDARWTDLLAPEAGAARFIHRIVLEIDDAGKTVRAMDEDGQLTRSAGAQGRDAKLQVAYTSSLGIALFQYEAGSRYGLLLRDDGTVGIDEAYRYSFSLDEMKTPVIDIITRAGYSYRPVISFSRCISG